VKINFDSIESHLKKLVESSTNLVSNRPVEDPRTAQVVIALRAYIQKRTINGESSLPEVLQIEVPEDSLTGWQDFPFNETLKDVLQESGQMPLSLPQTTLVGNSNLLEGEIMVCDVPCPNLPLDRTASMPALSMPEENILGDCVPENAFIIVNGLETISLTQSVFNIGRRLGNDLVIEDTRISREHAQIRAVKGQYVIFDLNSTGGTFVNSVRISQQSLFPGDVISLAGVPLVYGQDNPPAHAQTGPVEPFFNPNPIED
jgi:hypothetical protein